MAVVIFILFKENLDTEIPNIEPDKFLVTWLLQTKVLDKYICCAKSFVVLDQRTELWSLTLVTWLQRSIESTSLYL